jgi:hypothetical protein
MIERFGGMGKGASASRWDERCSALRYIIYIHRDDFDEMIPQIYDAIMV